MSAQEHLSDDAREQLIHQAALELATATTRHDRRVAWERLESLHKGRSRAQVDKMETEQGLRK